MSYGSHWDKKQERLARQNASFSSFYGRKTVWQYNAETMYGGKLPTDLFARLERVNALCEKVDGRLVSRQIIASIIEEYNRERCPLPRKSSYGTTSLADLKKGTR